MTAGSGATRYDVTPPWWFRNVFWLLVAGVSLAGSTRSAALGLLAAACFAVALVQGLGGGLRHRVRR